MSYQGLTAHDEFTRVCCRCSSPGGRHHACNELESLCTLTSLTISARVFEFSGASSLSLCVPLHASTLASSPRLHAFCTLIPSALFPSIFSRRGRFFRRPLALAIQDTTAPQLVASHGAQRALDPPRLPGRPAHRGGLREPCQDHNNNNNSSNNNNHNNNDNTNSNDNRTTKFCRCCGLEQWQEDLPAVQAMGNALQAAQKALHDIENRSAPFSQMTQVWNNFFIVYIHLFRYHSRELTGSGCDKSQVQNVVIDKGIECGMLSPAQLQELKSLII
ncbi:unnamed protein product [Polarella glacialis]|uniref:Uncharacterized protein n=1 Tax=Polarella glacialis TaxID=89957 RepID=A0A813FJ08_POLGL|nr:unnamed protein product [Polarella glacialis]